MSGKLKGLDRVVLLVVGLLLVLLALVVVDWRHHLVLSSYADSLQTGRLEDAVDSWWFPWLFAVVGVLLGALGLRWILGHVGSRGPAVLRTSASSESGRIEVDLRSLADVAAAHLATQAPIAHARGTTRKAGLTSVVELHAHVDPAADVESLTAAAAACSDQITAAFPDDLVTCRIVLGSPQRTKPGRVDKVRVRQPATTR
jgi:hypothetical protein